MNKSKTSACDIDWNEVETISGHVYKEPPTNAITTEKISKQFGIKLRAARDRMAILKKSGLYDSFIGSGHGKSTYVYLVRKAK